MQFLRGEDVLEVKREEVNEGNGREHLIYSGGKSNANSRYKGGRLTPGIWEGTTTTITTSCQGSLTDLENSVCLSIGLPR